MRFYISLWDNKGFVQKSILDNATSMQVVNELHGENTLQFRLPVRDFRYNDIAFRSIVRLHDNAIDTPSSTVYSSDSANKELTLTDATNFNIGDYVIVYTSKSGWVSQKTTAAVTAGNKQQISVDGIGSMLGDHYIKIADENGSETIKLLTVTTTTIVADVANDYESGASLTTPGISYVAKIITKVGNAIRLSRMDVEPLTGAEAEVRKINFQSFRIDRIEESREQSGVWATIHCNHIGYDLGDYNFFKDGRGDVSYALNAKFANVDEETDINSLLDDCLLRQVDADNNPIFVGAFIKGDLLRRRYSQGTISITIATGNATGSNTKWEEISAGSTLYVEGYHTEYTITYVESDTALHVTPNFSASAEGLNYLIIDKAIHTTDDLIQNDKMRVTYNSTAVSSDGTTSWANGNNAAGAILVVEGDDKEYILSKIVGDDNLILTSAVERTSWITGMTEFDYSIKPDRRPISFSKMTSLREVLTELSKTWTDETQDIWYTINEDRSIDIFRKPADDNIDPTSDLEIRYNYNLVKNLKGLKRTYEQSNVVNRIIPLGATSGWVNSESGISSDVSEVNVNRAWDVKLGTLIVSSTTANTTYTETTVADSTTWVITSVTASMVVRAGNSSGFVQSVAGGTITVDRWTNGTPTDNTDQAIVYSNQSKYYRFGDPVQIYDNYSDVTITSATQVTATFTTTANQYARADDGTVFTDDDTDSANPTVNDMNLLPAVPAVNDAYYFGADSKFRNIKLNITTPGSGVWTIAWEYHNGVNWTLLNNYIYLNHIFDFQPTSAGIRILAFNPPINWSAIMVNAKSAYWIRARVSGYTSIVTQPLGGQMWLGVAGIDTTNELYGGLIQVTGTPGKGQVRRIVSSTTDSVTISRKWDILPVGASAIASQNVGNSYIEGFGYRQLTPDAYTGTTVDVYDTLIEAGAYIGGMLMIVSGTGQGQVFAIKTNTMSALGGGGDLDSRITIDGTFLPIPDNTSRIEVVAKPIVVQEYITENYAMTFGAATVQVAVSPAWATDQWVGATVLVTDSTNIGESGICLSNTADTITLRANWSNLPAADSSIIIYRYNDVPLSLVSGLQSDTGKFNLTQGDKLILLLKESGGPLTIGKHFTKRSFVTLGTREYIQVEQGEGTNFTVNDLIFIGSKEYTGLVDFYRRGDQVVGQVAEIDSFSRTGSAVTASTAGTTTYTSTTVVDGTAWTLSSVKSGMIAYALDGGVDIEGTIVDVDNTTNTITVGSWYPKQPSNAVACTIYYADQLNFVDKLDTTPIPGDHVEIYSIVDSTSLRKYGLVEKAFEDSAVIDPRELIKHAQEFIDDYANLKPKYELDFMDLYNYDPVAYKYDSFELGDTVRVVDDDLNIDTNLRIIRLEYNPTVRADVKVQVSSSILPAIDSVRREVEEIEVRLDEAESDLRELQRQDLVPICTYWDTVTKKCTRIMPPNIFCNSTSARQDGRRVNTGEGLTKAHCWAFNPASTDTFTGTDSGMVTTTYINELNGINLKTWSTDANHQFAVDFDYKILKLSYAYAVTVVNNAAPTSTADLGDIEVRVRLDDYGEVVPFDENTGYGCYAQARRTTGAVVAVLDADIAIHIVGKFA